MDLGKLPQPVLPSSAYEDVPRIHAQRGLFLPVTEGAENTLRQTCIDVIRFRQHPGVVYKGAKTRISRSHLFPLEDSLSWYAAFTDTLGRAANLML